MARLRIRLEVKGDPPGEPGRHGLPLQTLANLAEEAQKLVRTVGKDTSLGDGYWLASNFVEGSLGFDVEFIGEADDDQVRHYNQSLASTISYRPNGNGGPHGISTDAIVQYAKVAEAIDLGQKLKVAVYEQPDEPRWFELTKQESVALLESLQTHVDYHGMVQGIIHSLFKESQPPHFDLRELATGRLVRCYYGPAQYVRVVKALKTREAVALVAGNIRASRITRRIESLQVERVEVAERLTREQLARLVGGAPKMTGRFTTSTFIHRQRRRDG